MTRKFDENMAEFFELEPTEIETYTPPQELVSINHEIDFDEDYKKTRNELDELIEQGKSALNDIMAIAKESEKSRDFEVASTLFSSLINANEKRLEIHKKVRDIANYKFDSNSSETTINNTLFVGSTADLTKLLKDQKNQEEIVIEDFEEDKDE